MRSSLFATAMTLALAGASPSEAQYIHAAAPPYCSPRGGDVCLPRERSGQTPNPGWDSAALSAYAERDVVYVPSVDILRKLAEVDESYAFLGRVQLWLFGPEGEAEELAGIRLESPAPLTRLRAKYLKWRMRSRLSGAELREIWIERFPDGSPDAEPSEVCEFVREPSGWNLECDFE